jgi:hypothetical protein
MRSARDVCDYLDNLLETREDSDVPYFGTGAIGLDTAGAYPIVVGFSLLRLVSWASLNFPASVVTPTVRRRVAKFPRTRLYWLPLLPN